MIIPLKELSKHEFSLSGINLIHQKPVYRYLSVQQPKQLNSTTLRANQLPGALKGIGRSAAEIEKELTNKLLKAQQEHEEIILEVEEFRPGTELGYNTPCPRELQEP